MLDLIFADLTHMLHLLLADFLDMIHFFFAYFLDVHDLLNALSTNLIFLVLNGLDSIFFGQLELLLHSYKLHQAVNAPIMCSAPDDSLESWIPKQQHRVVDIATVEV